MSHRAPSTSPSPSDGRNVSARQSMGPASRGAGLSLASPRPGGGFSGARPASELLGSGGMFTAQNQTPEAEAIDLWFENLQNYEATLEEMAAASLDVNFKEELSAIEQWFKVLSEAERTAALYSLLQHSTQVQIRFFITVLQQMARSDPMTALLSPAIGGSMQTQMETRLASLQMNGPKSPGFPPSSPSARNFSSPQNRQSLGLDTAAASFLSPDTAAHSTASPSIGNDAAVTLAQQRARLAANHRVSAPGLDNSSNRNTWGPNSQLGQVVEQQNAPAQEITVPTGRPSNIEVGSPRPGQEAMSPMPGGSWGSAVNTPLIPMFKRDARAVEDATAKLNEWTQNQAGVPRMSDPKIHRRASKTQTPDPSINAQVYGDDGELVSTGGQQPQQQQQQTPRNVSQSGGLRNTPGGNNWTGARSPALSNVSSNRYDDGGQSLNAYNGMNNGMGLISPALGIPMSGGMSPYGMMNMANLNGMANAMGIPAETILAAQIMAQQQQQQQWMQPNGRRIPPARSPGPNKTSSSNSGRNATPDKKTDEEDVDPALLTDIPGWLRSLRLHKYTPNFENMQWQDMVAMDEAALEAKGVAALGARRKMLKTFEVVRKKMGIPEPGASA